MYNPRAKRAADSREFAKMVQQRIHQRAGMNSRARMDHHSGWLVDCHQVVILIENPQRDILRRGMEWRLVRRFDVDGFSRANQVRRPGALSVRQYAAIANPLLDTGAAELRQ